MAATGGGSGLSGGAAMVGGVRPEGMYVVKRNGEFAPVKFDEITDRIVFLANNPSKLSSFVDPVRPARDRARSPWRARGAR